MAKDSEITIYDLQGNPVKSYKSVVGILEFPIDDLGLKAGIYMIRITASGVNLGFKKRIVTGDQVGLLPGKVCLSFRITYSILLILASLITDDLEIQKRDYEIPR